MKILLADDHGLLLEGLRNLIVAHNMEVVGTARDGFDAIHQARLLKPDVILMDIRMPKCNGLEATKEIVHDNPDAKIVMLTTSTEDDDLFEAIKCGAYGYLLKSMDADELIDALQHVREGIPPFSPGLAAKILREFSRMNKSNSEPDKNAGRQSSAESELTEREIEVLSLISQGYSYKEAGEKLNLSPRTIKYHMNEIMTRLHFEHRSQALAYAGRIGLAGKTDQ